MAQREKRKRFSDARGNTRGHLINGRARKDVRREEAFAREAAWRALPITERLSRLPSDGAKRERARLEAALVKQSEKVSQPKKGEKKQAKVAT